MSETAVKDPIEGELMESPKDIPIVFNVSDAKIEQLRSQLTGLTIADTKSYDLVVRGIAACRTLRGNVEKCRKGLKEHALAYGRKVDAEAKRLRVQLEGIEDPLNAEKARVDAEKERKRREAEEAKQKVVDERIKALVAFGKVPNPLLVAGWSDAQFEVELQLACDDHMEKVAAEAKAKEEAAKAEAERQKQMRAEREKLEADRAELAKLRAAEEERQRKESERLKAEQAKIEEANRAEREKLEADRKAIQAEKDRLEKIERDRLAKIEAERKKAEQAKLEKEKAERAKVEAEQAAAKLESLKPDIEKIRSISKSIRSYVWPKVTSEEAMAFVRYCKDKLEDIAEQCEDWEP